MSADILAEVEMILFQVCVAAMCSEFSVFFLFLRMQRVVDVQAVADDINDLGVRLPVHHGLTYGEGRTGGRPNSSHYVPDHPVLFHHAIVIDPQEAQHVSLLLRDTDLEVHGGHICGPGILMHPKAQQDMNQLIQQVRP